MKRIAGIATIPGREEQAQRTIESLLPQVDQIFITLNGHKDHLPIAKTAQYFANNELGDAAKFNALILLPHIYEGIFFGCDDDIIYPEGYCDKLEAGLKRHGGIVSLGGKAMRPNAQNWHKHRTIDIHCTKRESLEDKQIHIPLTGAMACYTNIVSLSKGDFPSKNMADIHMGIYCQKNRIKVTALGRKEGWLQVQKVGWTIFNGGKGTGKEHKLIQSINWRYQHGK